MEGQVVTQIPLPLAYFVSATIGLCSAIAALFWLYNKIMESRQQELKDHKKEIMDLTKSFVDSQNQHARVIENVGKIIEKLPESIVMHIKSQK